MKASPKAITILTGLAFIVITLATSCKQNVEEITQEEGFSFGLPAHFPAPVVPEDNPITAAKVQLGKRLFEEVILSRDSSVSCKSCHKPKLAFADGLNLPRGVDDRRAFRNAPGLTNVMYQPYMFMDGGNPDLEAQIIAPIENPDEMDLNFARAVMRIQDHPEYPDIFMKVFGEGVSASTLTKAIAAYERTILSYNSNFDKAIYGGEESALSDAGRRGYQLFQDLGCQNCHSGVLFTDFSFRNNGLKADYSADKGRARVTLKDEDVGKFKVPGLRNVSLTAPYMHDGSLETLEEVINHYAAGGKGHVNQSPLIKGFVISDAEKDDLIEFLQNLEDITVF